MECNIDSLFEYLLMNNDIEQQELGIEAAKEIKHLSVLIMPMENKLTWENCAKVLASKSDEELKLYFIRLFEWLKDMNWPGAYIIYDRLISVSDQEIIAAYEYSLSVAEQTKDYVWERVLRDYYMEYIMNLLDWNRNANEQAKGIELAKKVQDIKAFLQPCNKKYNKNVWENCAKILAERTDEELSPYLVELLEWLQDLNWPGAVIIAERLKSFSGEELKKSLENAIAKANAI